MSAADQRLLRLPQNQRQSLAAMPAQMPRCLRRKTTGHDDDSDARRAIPRHKASGSQADSSSGLSARKPIPSFYRPSGVVLAVLKKAVGKDECQPVIKQGAMGSRAQGMYHSTQTSHAHGQNHFSKAGREVSTHKRTPPPDGGRAAGTNAAGGRETSEPISCRSGVPAFTGRLEEHVVLILLDGEAQTLGVGN